MGESPGARAYIEHTVRPDMGNIHCRRKLAYVEMKGEDRNPETGCENDLREEVGWGKK